MNESKISTLKEKLKLDREKAYVKREKEKKEKHEAKRKSNFKIKIKLLNENDSKVSTETETAAMSVDVNRTESEEKENKRPLKLNSRQRRFEKSAEQFVRKDLPQDAEIINPEKHKGIASSGKQETKNCLNNMMTNQKNVEEPDRAKRKKKSVPKKKNKHDIQREATRKRVQAFRAKMTEEQREEKRRKDRERYKRNKEEGRVKNIASLSKKEQKMQRSKWKEASLKYRRTRKNAQATDRYLRENSPPTTDDDMDANIGEPFEHNSILQNSTNSTKCDQNSVLNKNYNAQSDISENCSSSNFNTPSKKKIRGRKMVRRDKSSCYRKLKQAENTITELKKKLEQLRKKVERRDRLIKQNLNNTCIVNKSKRNTPATFQIETSPNTKVKQITQGRNVPQDIKKRLLFGEVLCAQLRDNSKNLNHQNEKAVASKLFSGKIVKKYKMIGQTRNILSYKMHRKYLNNLKLCQYERKKKNSVKIEVIRRSIQEFLERDINSRICVLENEIL